MAVELTKENSFLEKLCVSARSIDDTTGEYIPIVSYGLTATLTGKAKEDTNDPSIVTVQVTNTGKEVWCGVIKWELPIEGEGAPFFLLPGYMYGNNTAYLPSSGRKKFPRLKKHPKGCPESSFFMTRSDRLAAPIAMVYLDGCIRAISAKPYYVQGDRLTYAGFTCSLDKPSVGYTLGYENAPWLFVQTATIKERAPLADSSCIKIAPGEQFIFDMEIYDYESDSVLGLYEGLESVYFKYHEAPRTVPDMTIEKATRLLAGAVSEYAWLPKEHMYSGFVFDREEGFAYNKIGSLSWTNGLSVALPQLQAGIRLKDETIRKRAQECIDYIVENSINENSGLLYDAVENGKWSVHGWWYDGMRTPGHSGYLQGQAVYYILKAYALELKHRDTVHKSWLDTASLVLKHLNCEMNSDYEYPFVLSEQTGAGLQYYSLGSAWCLAADAYYMYLTGDTAHLKQAQASEKHYYTQYVSKMECFGGPLDTDLANDNEGILAYIRAVSYLHKLTGDDTYLDHLRIALCYEFSFKLAYNTPVSIAPLGKVGWTSCGGSITSVANPHIHPMSSTIVDEMIYYLQFRDDEYVKSRLKDTVGWGLQTFNSFDKEYDYGRAGWMSERFCFCQGLLTEHYPDGSIASTWFALMPWASASVIEGFAGDAWEESF